MTGINDKGEAIGNYSEDPTSGTPKYSFIYKDGAYTILNGLPSGAFVTGINDSEQVVGYYLNGPNYSDFIATASNTAPPAPSQLALSSASAITANIANTTIPTIVGSGMAGDTVNLYDGSTLLGSATVSSNGSWSFTLPDLLVGWSHSLTATQTDPNGNTSTPSGRFQIVTPPTILATISNDVYSNIIPAGYPRIDPKTFNLGFFAEAFQSGSQIVIAFRGTEAFSNLFLNDLADLSFLPGFGVNGLLLSYIQQAVSYVQDIKANFAPPGSGNTITFTGHSLGGAIADLMGLDFGDQAITFSAPGVQQFIQSLTSSGTLQPLSDGSTVINYRVKGDDFSTLGTQLGNGTTLSFDSDMPDTFANVSYNHGLLVNEPGYLIGHHADIGITDPARPPQFGPDYPTLWAGTFDSSGRFGLLADASGPVQIELLNGTTPVLTTPIVNSPFDGSWAVSGVGDFNGDGLTDLVWRHSGDGLTEIHLLNGIATLGGGVIANNPFDSSWSISAVGDFNGDGKADLAWQRNTDSLLEIQFLDGPNSLGGGVVANNPFDASWKIVTSGDFNHDGHTDLAWRRPNGLTEIELLNGAKIAGGGIITNNPFGPGWNVVGPGDFNGDGYSDLVWQRPTDGLVEIQYLQGAIAVGGGLMNNNGFAGGSWQVVGVGDFLGNGHPDLIYRRPSDGLTEVQFLNGFDPVGGGAVTVSGNI